METKLPNWLPPIIPLTEYDGNYSNYISNLYELFQKDFFEIGVKFSDKPVHIGTALDDTGRYRTFEHITSELDIVKGERLPALERCERILWIKAIFENINSSDTDILIWEKSHSSRDLRTNIFLPELNFHIVLKNLKDKYILITMIYPINIHQKCKYLKEYDRYK